MGSKYKKQFGQMKDMINMGAVTLQTTRVLNDTSIGGLTGTTTGLVGLGVTSSVSNIAFNMASGTCPKKKRKR